jgi:hypothetical protein
MIGRKIAVYGVGRQAFFGLRANTPLQGLGAWSGCACHPDVLFSFFN